MLRCVVAVALIGRSLAWDLPTDCRNQTLEKDGGSLPIMSYHIHYTTANESVLGEMKSFYEAFVANFSDKFWSGILGTRICPIGPNYGAYSSKYFPSKTMCSFEPGPLEFEIAEGVDAQGSPWGSLHQRAFFIPIEFIDEAWEWSRANRGNLDIIKHPNTGCMAADHRLFKVWDGTPHHIYTLRFPCNMPATGCLDSDYPLSRFSCGCNKTRASEAPKDSCKNCWVMGEFPPEHNATFGIMV